MVKTDYDYDRVAMAQEDSEEQVQGVRVHRPAQHVHLPPCFFASAAERVLEQQQPVVLYGRDHAAGYDVYVWDPSKADKFSERL